MVLKLLLAICCIAPTEAVNHPPTQHANRTFLPFSCTFSHPGQGNALGLQALLLCCQWPSAQLAATHAFRCVKCPAGCHACFQVCQAGRHAALLACPSCNDVCSSLLASSRITPGFCIADLQHTSLVGYLSRLEQPLGTSGPAGYCHVSLTAASLAVIEPSLRSITNTIVISWLSDGMIAIVRCMHLQ